MSLDKAIQFCKEHRKQYTGAAAWDDHCRPHGGCPWCEDTRTYQDRKARSAADQQLKELEDNLDLYKDIL